jgi:hypothetical protein
MKHFILGLLFLFAVTAAKADNIINVDVKPGFFGPLLYDPTPIPGGVMFQSDFETIRVNFAWDLTTGVMSDFQVSAAGLFDQGLALVDASPTAVNFANAAGDTFGWHFVSDLYSTLPPFETVPGTYFSADFQFHCEECFAFKNDIVPGSITVSTPEPGSFSLVAAGLALLSVLFFGKAWGRSITRSS